MINVFCIKLKMCYEVSSSTDANNISWSVFFDRPGKYDDNETYFKFETINGSFESQTVSNANTFNFKWLNWRNSFFYWKH